MKRYLDPKADLTFKKIFGEHPDLVKGMMKEKLEMAKKMKAAGMPLALIIELTGLTEEAIQQSEPTNHQ